MSTLQIKKENFYYSVKLSRPEKHNAFNPEMIAELTEFFKHVDSDKFTGAVLLTGSGSSFCTGADLQWMQSMAKFNYEENRADAERLFNMFETISQCNLPIISYVHGHVFGGGVGLMSVSDVVIAEANTKFSFSEVKLGISPAVISSFILRKMNKNKANEYMITGRTFDAEAAHRAGLVEFVGRELEVQQYLKDTLEHVRMSGPEAVRETKKLIRYLQTASPSQVKSKSIDVIAERRVSDEGQEGLKSFFDKRKPSWIWNVSDEPKTT